MVEAGKKKCAYFCVTSDQDSTFDFLASLFFSFLFIRLVRFADNYGENGKLPVPVNMVLEEFPNIGAIVDFKKKISTTRSRAINISVIFQNLAQLQNRYPDGAWQEILGNCDTQLFLGCTDETTAKLVSDRTGEVTVAVASKTKNLNSWRVSDYTPEYREARSIGKRKLLTPDEILRLPVKEALVIMRGQKVLKVTKFDYTNHPHSKLIVKKKASTHIPEWRKMLDEEYERKHKKKTSIVAPVNEENDVENIDTLDEEIAPARITLNVKPAKQTPDIAPKDEEQELSAVDKLRNKNKGGDGNGNKPRFSQIDKTAITKK